jgi:hypothetical protein
MKIKTFTFNALARIFKALFIVFLFGIMTAMAPAADTSATGFMDIAVYNVLEDGTTFYAATSLSPAVIGGATIVVEPIFAGMQGFADATISAYMPASGTMLYVTLAGFTGAELPAGATLAYITIQTSTGDRGFVLKVDGGLVVIHDDTF